ncbi:hypothetical protein JCM11641_006348 [Rhodosporidiobolus odoratus]
MDQVQHDLAALQAAWTAHVDAMVLSDAQKEAHKADFRHWKQAVEQVVNGNAHWWGFSTFRAASSRLKLDLERLQKNQIRDVEQLVQAWELNGLEIRSDSQYRGGPGHFANNNNNGSLHSLGTLGRGLTARQAARYGYSRRF